MLLIGQAKYAYIRGKKRLYTCNNSIRNTLVAMQEVMDDGDELIVLRVVTVDTTGWLNAGGGGVAE